MNGRHVAGMLVVVVLVLSVAACGGQPKKDFHLVLIGEMEACNELDT